MFSPEKSSNRPQRTLIAYCALAERLNKPNANMYQALTPFFTEACQDFAGQPFDATKFSEAVRKNYGIEIPKLAVLAIAEHLAVDGVLEVVTGYAQAKTYKYSNTIQSIGNETNAITEVEIAKVLELFRTYCAQHASSHGLETEALDEEFLERLLHLDSMRLLSRRESTIVAKRTNETITLSRPVGIDENFHRSLKLDFLVSSFLINLRDTDTKAFEVVSNIAFANMAAEAIACFREPPSDQGDLHELTVVLDSPLILDMLGVNSEYADYGKDLLKMLKDSGCKVAVLDHSIEEAENTIKAKLHYLRSGINKLTIGNSVQPNFLNALCGNVAERVESRLEISVHRDPETHLLRSSPNTVGDIEADMNSKMLAWKNDEAKAHDRKSIWALVSLRDSTVLQTRICKLNWLLLTRNKPLQKIANDSWKTWLKGATKHSTTNIERWAPLSMSDKQFAGYVWARNGGGKSTISQSLLLSHCSAAVRPRADIKAKAYNLVLELHDSEQAHDIVALLEDREGARALMSATLGNPENLDLNNINQVVDRVKLAAGDFAAARVREEAEKLRRQDQSQHKEDIARIENESKATSSALKSENLRIAQANFSTEQATAALITEKQNLQAELDEKQRLESRRVHKIIDSGFTTGCNTYKVFKWSLVLLFGIASWLISSNLLPISSGLAGVISVSLACFGFWFVPELLEKPSYWIADRQFQRVISLRDDQIVLSNISRDYKLGKWSLKE